MLLFDIFVRAVRVGSVKRFSFSGLVEESNGQVALVRVAKTMIQKWLVYGTLKSIKRTEVDPALAFDDVARLCEVDWDRPGSHGWFCYGYRTAKLPRVVRFAPMVLELADGTDEKIAKTEAGRPIHRKMFDTRGVLFDFKKAVWVEYLDKKMDYFEIPSLAA